MTIKSEGWANCDYGGVVAGSDSRHVTADVAVERASLAASAAVASETDRVLTRLHRLAYLLIRRTDIPASYRHHFSGRFDAQCPATYDGTLGLSSISGSTYQLQQGGLLEKELVILWGSLWRRSPIFCVRTGRRAGAARALACTPYQFIKLFLYAAHFILVFERKMARAAAGPPGFFYDHVRINMEFLMYQRIFLFFPRSPLEWRTVL
ncbi:hypothetical protein EVAR_28710_1 [Eumeta japonica]|uniref:Uncharacterized protein n=1 Tax=Eumeta variegata TaxID=151549 RepID=A0A4C1V5T3_EUMVA|nr:hypothetical protein EVAR_28710_1 [Eumeta japonica]